MDAARSRPARAHSGPAVRSLVSFFAPSSLLSFVCFFVFCNITIRVSLSQFDVHDAGRLRPLPSTMVRTFLKEII